MFVVKKNMHRQVIYVRMHPPPWTKPRSDKTRWFLTNFEWNRSDFEYCTINIIPGDITLPDAEGNPYVVNKTEVDKSFEFLGVLLSMNGSFDKWKEVLTKKAHIFGQQIGKLSVSKNEAQYTYHASFMTIMQYPMMGTQFSKQEWTSIVWPARSIAANRAGLCKYLSLGLFYCPKIYQGLGFQDPYFMQ